MKNKYVALTNRDISENYRDIEVLLYPSHLTGAFAYWATRQNNNKVLVLDSPLMAFSKYITPFFKNPEVPERFTYKRLSAIIDESQFERIPEILALNEMKPDFIDLGALARNIFYMILREEITQPL